MEIQFVKVSPNQNMTLLIETPIAREKQLEIAKTLIAYHSVYAEQAGYIEQPKNKKALARLQMMAGEFCGNATLALATYLFAKEQPPAFSKKIIPLEVSGADDIVYCHIQKTQQHFMGTLEMPLPLCVEQKQYVLHDKSYLLETVCFAGIWHIIVPKSLWGANATDYAQQAANAWGNQIDAEAFGILIWDETTQELQSLVCVKNASLIWERGCGSGTSAIGIVTALQQKSNIALDIQQTGGIMHIAVTYEKNKISHIQLSVPIAIVAKGTAYIP